MHCAKFQISINDRLRPVCWTKRGEFRKHTLTKTVRKSAANWSMQNGQEVRANKVRLSHGLRSLLRRLRFSEGYADSEGIKVGGILQIADVILSMPGEE